MYVASVLILLPITGVSIGFDMVKLLTYYVNYLLDKTSVGYWKTQLRIA